MPRNVGQIPIYYNHLNTGRPNPKWFTKFTTNYLDVPNDPLFPFGYGLSYTTFSYGPLTLSGNSLTRTTLDGNDHLTASVTVTNTGSQASSEVVQLYIRDMVGSIARPVQELKGFERITLQPSESRKVTFTITPDLLKFYNADLVYDCEPGEFDLMIGPNSRDVQHKPFTLQ
jgi:beta-glucosidase